MANGLPWSKEGFAALKAFFERLEPTLSDFAKSRNLMIVRYDHDAPSWSFLFRHPHGGTGKIDFERVGDDSVRIWRYWWKDDYDLGTRFIRSENRTLTNLSHADIAAALSGALDQILAWEISSLIPRGGMGDVWHSTFDAESFKALERRYPLPNLGPRRAQDS